MGEAAAILAVAVLIFVIGHCNRSNEELGIKMRYECTTLCHSDKSCFNQCMGIPSGGKNAEKN